MSARATTAVDRHTRDREIKRAVPLARCLRTFADSLYRRLTPYNITSAPSIASLIASIVLPGRAREGESTHTEKGKEKGREKQQQREQQHSPFIFVKSNQVT
jgi:hypothetical protein